MIESTVCVNILVTGQVQGVFYRASTLAQAQRLNLTGWVRNCSDGRVEITAQGEKASVDALIEWSRQGPIAARVDDVQVTWKTPDAGFEMFAIRR